MAEFIIDTNVPIIADGNSHMSVACEDASAYFMEELLKPDRNHTIVVDIDGHIIEEYTKKFKSYGQNSYGNRLLKYIYTYQWNIEIAVIRHVAITLTEDGNFSEVHQSIIDAGFDPADRKFVAAAVANNFEAPIVVASDSDWLNHIEVIERSGIKVRLLCREDLEKISKNKKK